MVRPGPDFDGATLLDAADALVVAAANSTEPEPYYRSVMNRAYYAAFVSLLNRIPAVCGRGVVPERGVHQWVKQGLERTSLRPLQLMKGQLAALEADRDWADYEPQSACPTIQRAQDCVAKSRRLLIKLRGGLPDHLVRKIAEARR
jgi:hypothetical protein